MKTHINDIIPARNYNFTPFGVAVKKRIFELGYTIGYVEQQVGMPYKYLAKLLCGSIKNSKYAPLVADFLEIDIEEYVGN